MDSSEKLEVKVDTLIDTINDLKLMVTGSFARSSEKIKRAEKDISNCFALQRSNQEEEREELGQIREKVEKAKEDMDEKLETGIMSNRKIIIGGFAFCTLAIVAVQFIK